MILRAILVLLFLASPAWALQPVYVDQLGAKPNGVVLTTCSMTAASAVLTCTGAKFATTDVGKVIGVYGAKTAVAGYPQVLYTTIASRQSLTQVTLAVAATITVNPSTRVVYGTDNTTVLQRIIDTTVAAPDGHGGNIGGHLIFGPGLYIVKTIALPCSRVGTFTDGVCPRSYNNIWFQGAGQPTTTLENIDPTLPQPPMIDIGEKTDFPAVFNDGNALLSGFQISDLTMRQVANGLNISAATISSFVMVDGLIQRVSFLGGSYECMHLSGQRLTIRDNYATGCGLGGPDFPFQLSGYEITCSDCFFINNAYEGPYASESSFRRGIVQGNQFTCDPVTGGRGFEFGSSGAGIYDMTVIGNVIRNCGMHLGNGNGTANRIYLLNNVIINGAIEVTSGVEATGSGQTFWPGELDTITHGVSVIDGNTFLIDGTMAYSNFGPMGIVVGDLSVPFEGQESWQITNNTFAIRQTWCSTSPFAACHSDATCGAGTCIIPATVLDLRMATGGVPWAPSTACTQEGTIPGTQTGTSYVAPLVYNGFYYRCTTSGTSAATEPTWPVALGATVTDGTAVWTNAGRKPTIWVANNTIMGPDGRAEAYHRHPTGEVVLREFTDRDAVQISHMTANYPWALLADSGPNSPVGLELIPAATSYGDHQRFFAALPTVGYYPINTLITNTAPASGQRGWVATRTGRAGATWGGTTAYAFAAWVVPTVDNAHVYTQRTGAGCTSAGSQPSWPTGAGATVSDGTCVWKESGAAVLWLQF